MPARACTAVGAFVALAVFVLGARCAVSEDGVSYLWMAQQFAVGRPGDALSMVFPPGFPVLLAPFVALGVAPHAAAVAVGALCLALLVWPIARIAAALAPAAVLPAVLLLPACPHLLRVAAEVYSEPPFLLLMAAGTAAGLRRRWWWTGACAGAAFWIRPEGLVLAASFVLAAPRTAWRALLPAGLAAMALAAARAAAGCGFDPLPLLAFHELRDDLPARGDVLQNLLDAPAAWVEALGLAAVLALAGVRHCRGLSLALPWQLLLQLGAVLTFVVRKRFFLSAAVPALALAGRELAAWPARWRQLVLAVAAVVGLAVAWSGSGNERGAEVDVGRWLATTLPRDAVLVTDLPRVAWYAGRRPPPARHFTAAQTLAQAHAVDVRCVVLSADSKRGQFAELAAGLADAFVRAELPASLRADADARGIAVFVRR